MAKRYSLYEAKTKLSSLVRQVREGQAVWITLHGKPVAELRPIEEEPEQKSLDEIFEEMERTGEAYLVGGKPWPGKFKVGKPAPGALKRFLEERD